MEDHSMINVKDHDLLVRLDEKVDNLGKILESLIISLDARSKSIDDLNTFRLLHEKETETQWKKYDELSIRVAATETRLKTDENVLFQVERASIMIWVSKHPKLTVFFLITAFLIIDLHDVIVPYLLSILGYKVP